jgi:hypothetical protein
MRPEPMSDETTQRKRLREDPLSIALIAAALLLVVVYAWDQHTREALMEQMARAESIRSNFAVDSARCSVGTADKGGRTLVFACAGVEPRVVASAAATSDAVRREIGAFDRVHFRSPDAALDCPPRLDAWPEECSSLAQTE